MLACGSALAEPSAAEKETARRLMAEGRTLRDQGDAKGALRSFMGADSIMLVPSTGIEVAKTQIALGQLVEARDKALAVTRIPVGKHEPAPFAEARAAAQQLEDDLTKRIPTIKIVVTGAPPNVALNVTVDGESVPEAALVGPYAVDPGHHVVAAGLRGGAQKTGEVDVVERDAKTVTLEVPAGLASDAPPVETPVDTTPEAPPARGVPVLAYVGFIVGGVGLVTGGVTGAIALAKTHSAENGGCVNDRCPPSTDSTLNTANTMATVSTVAFIVRGRCDRRVNRVLASSPRSARAGAGSGDLLPLGWPWLARHARDVLGGTRYARAHADAPPNTLAETFIAPADIRVRRAPPHARDRRGWDRPQGPRPRSRRHTAHRTGARQDSAPRDAEGRPPRAPGPGATAG